MRNVEVDRLDVEAVAEVKRCRMKCEATNAHPEIKHVPASAAPEAPEYLTLDVHREVPRRAVAARKRARATPLRPLAARRFKIQQGKNAAHGYAPTRGDVVQTSHDLSESSRFFVRRLVVFRCSARNFR